MRKSFLIAISLFIVTICPSHTKADTVSLSGQVIVTGFFGNFDINFSGTDSDGTTFGLSHGIGSTVSGVNVPRLFLVPGGTSINLSGSLILLGADFSSGLVTINGISSAPNLVDLSMLSTTFVTVPFTDVNTLIFTAPCTVNGSVSGKTGGGAGFRGGCSAQLFLDKKGTDSSGNGLYSFQGISYSFFPVPEPATVVLLGSGLIGVIVGVMRKNSHRP